MESPGLPVSQSVSNIAKIRFYISGVGKGRPMSIGCYSAVSTTELTIMTMMTGVCEKKT